MINGQKLDEMMLKLGFRDRLLGTGMLRYAVTVWTRGKQLCKELYPEVGKRYGVSGARVERDMRYAIEDAWMRADMDVVEHYFGASVDARRGKPVIADFLSTAVRVCEDED